MKKSKPSKPRFEQYLQTERDEKRLIAKLWTIRNTGYFVDWDKVKDDI